MAGVTIFAPSPTLTVTVERGEGTDEIHFHAGGQGVWQARMLLSLGAPVTLCCVLTGEVGAILHHLLEDLGITVEAVGRQGRGSAYVHDRRGGERIVVAEEAGDPIGRHELDELYSAALREGLRTGLVILSGPVGESALPADTYRRLTSDLRSGGAVVIADLAGERLDAVVEGGVDILKVSHEELLADGLADSDSTPDLGRAMAELRVRGAGAVIVTRADEPLLLHDAEGLVEITPPQLEVADHRGAGDSLTAGVAAAIARGDDLRAAVRLGAAAGALNVTRHGLGTGDRGAIEQLLDVVVARDLPAPDGPAVPVQRDTGRVSPDGLATLARPPGDADGGDVG